VSVCDLWKVNLERATTPARDLRRQLQLVAYIEDYSAGKEVDAGRHSDP